MKQIVSVLFSEPKIPQLSKEMTEIVMNQCFSALQRAENSSIAAFDRQLADVLGFSALQRAENSSINRGNQRGSKAPVCFSALQRAENSSIPTLAPASIHIPDCDDHASSFLSLPGASP